MTSKETCAGSIQGEWISCNRPFVCALSDGQKDCHKLRGIFHEGGCRTTLFILDRTDAFPIRSIAVDGAMPVGRGWDFLFRSVVHRKRCVDRLFLGESTCLRHGSITGTMEKTANWSKPKGCREKTSPLFMRQRKDPRPRFRATPSSAPAQGRHKSSMPCPRGIAR